MRYADFYRRSIEDRIGFWAEQATAIDWQRPFETVCDYSNPPFARWFVGGTTNLCHNAIDRHLKDRADQNALIWVSTEVDEERIYTYRELLRMLGEAGFETTATYGSLNREPFQLGSQGLFAIARRP